MNRRQTMAIADSDLRMFTQLRHQLLSARIGRLVHVLAAAEQQARRLADQLNQLNDEVKQLRHAWYAAVTGNLHGAGLFHGILRARDIDMRRMHARVDIQREDCERLQRELHREKQRLSGLDLRLDFYRKIHRQARGIREDRADERERED